MGEEGGEESGSGVLISTGGCGSGVVGICVGWALAPWVAVGGETVGWFAPVALGSGVPGLRVNPCFAWPLGAGCGVCVLGLDVPRLSF